MSRSALIKAVCLTIFISTSLSAAAVYFVDNTHPKAADNNPGTAAQPLLTISAAARLVKPGDEVVVRPGVYRESVILTVSGTKEAPIVFRSEVKHKAIVCAADVMANPVNEGMGVWSFTIPAPYMKSSPWIGGMPQWIYMDGVPLERADARDRLIPGTFYIDFEALRAYVSPPEDVDIKKVTFEYAHRQGLFSPGHNGQFSEMLDDIHIKGFKLMYNAAWFRGIGPIRASGRRWLIEDNHVQWTSYRGVETDFADDFVIRNNLIEWAGCAAIGGTYCTDMLVEKNIVRYNNWRMFQWSNEGGGSKWLLTIDGRFRDNEFAYNYGPGLWLDAMNTGTIYERNICHDNSVRSLFSEANWDEIIQDNICYNTGCSGILNSSGSGLVIRRNVSFNNGIGITNGGAYNRRNHHNAPPYAHANFIEKLNRIPDITRERIDRWEAGYVKYYMAPDFAMTNNNVVWDNIMFDNVRTMMENRDYRKPSAIDRFVNNFSDYNMYWAKSQETIFNYDYIYQYRNLDEWRQASSRDMNSTFADPRDPKTRLPEWAQASRKDWDLKMRPITDVDGTRDDGVRQRLVPSPMGQICIGRILRSPYLHSIMFEDSRIRGSVIEVDGQRTLALWTSNIGERCYLRLRLDVPKVVLENGYMVKKDVDLPNGNIDVLVTYNPTYIRGIGEKFTEQVSGVLKVQAFNIADQPVPASVTFINDAKEPALLKVNFSSTKGYSVEPASVEQQLAPGQKQEIKLALKPDGTMRRGIGMVRMQALLGSDAIRRLVIFNVGDGESKIPRAPEGIVIDGNLEEWGDIVKTRLPLASISDVSQSVSDDKIKAMWKGSKDLSARLYSAWTKDALYVAAVVTDDMVLPAAVPADLDKTDTLQIGLDARSPDMQWQKEPGLGCYEVRMALSDKGQAQPVCRVNNRTRVNDVKSALVKTADGYVMEMMIPLSKANFPDGQWASGRPVKLSMVVRDSDDLASPRRRIFVWTQDPLYSSHEGASRWETMDDTLGWPTVVFE